MDNQENFSPVDRGAAPPGLSGILETALYVDDLERAEHFYGHILGLVKIFTVPGRQLAFRCQESLVLIFKPEHTEREQIMINGAVIPLHGARGAGHMAFSVAKSELNAWRDHFRTVGVAIESEVSWPNGAYSIYFRDPSGNSLELATPDMWKSQISDVS